MFRAQRSRSHSFTLSYHGSTCWGHSSDSSKEWNWDFMPTVCLLFSCQINNLQHLEFTALFWSSPVVEIFTCFPRKMCMVWHLYMWLSNMDLSKLFAACWRIMQRLMRRARKVGHLWCWPVAGAWTSIQWCLGVPTSNTGMDLIASLSLFKKSDLINDWLNWRFHPQTMKRLFMAPRKRGHSVWGCLGYHFGTFWQLRKRVWLDV